VGNSKIKKIKKIEKLKKILNIGPAVYNGKRCCLQTLEPARVKSNSRRLSQGCQKEQTKIA